MLWGMPWSGLWGSPDHMIEILEAVSLGTSIRVRFKPLSGYGQYFRLVIDGRPIGPPFYAPDSAVMEWTGYADYSQTLHHVSVVPMGNNSSPEVDVSGQQDLWESGRSNRIKVTIVPAPEVFSLLDSAQLTSWSLTGVDRFSNCRPHLRRPQWGVLDVTLTDAAGTRTVTVKVNGTTVASGSRVGDGSITLAEANDSGISGSVTVTYTGDVTSGAYVVVRFPASYPIHYRTTIFGGGDFPRTAEGEVFDYGRGGTSYTFRSGNLAGGTYYVVNHQKDDAGNESTNTDAGGATVTVATIPGAPGMPAYVSGDQSNTRISWTASATAGATYNIYDSLTTGVVDVLNVSHSEAAGTTAKTLNTLADATFTGTRYILVRAVSGGVEEQNVKLLKLEYLLGAVVLPRPNAPGVAGRATVSGRTLTLPVSIRTNEQAVAAATVEMYLFAVGASPNYAAASSSTAVPSGTSGTTNVSVSATAAGDGNYMVAVRTVSAAAQQSSNTETYGPFKLSTAVPTAPASSSVEAGF